MSADSTSVASPLELGSAVVQRPERSAQIEWLETNGLGDFACGTVAGPNTRRQHGLFSARAEPGGRPMLLLAGLDVILERDGAKFELSCHQYAGARHPEGYRFCTMFHVKQFPEWRFQVEGGALIQRLFMPRGKRCVVNSWTLDAASSGPHWRLKVRPLCAFRDADALTRFNDRADLHVRPEGSVSEGSLRRDGGAVSIAPYPGCPKLFLQFGRAEVKAEALWYYRFQHPWDIALGLDGSEDYFSPCEFAFDLSPGGTVSLIAGIERISDSAEMLEARERDRRAALRLPDLESDATARVLARAADVFVAADAGGRKGLVAGYPEPRADLRMALIALPGILLCTRRLGEAKDVLDSALSALLVPDASPPGDEPLWFIRAAELYLDHSRDWDFLRDRLQPGCESLAQRYIENASDDGFRLAPDGLLASNNPARALTWMDAAIGEWPVTPRAGKPVEVNALWHHALGLLARWSARRLARRSLGGGGSEPQKAQRFAAMRELAGRSFRERFWNESQACLFDVVDQPSGAPRSEPQSGTEDAAIRPNQLFAIALSADLLDRRQAAGVLAVVEKRLLAPHGLRTLSLEDRAFQPRYGGSALDRAAARHQGSIYPWLLGAYADAVFRVHGRTPRACARVAASLQTILKEHLGEGCLGQVAELFSGAPPHTPQGDFAHAAAVGEIIRAYSQVAGTQNAD